MLVRSQPTREAIISQPHQPETAPAPSRRRADRRWLLGLFVLGWALRLVHLLTVRDSPLFVYPILDPRMYDEWGLRIAAGDWLGQRPFFQDPLYPYLLGVVYALVGHRYVVVALLQGLLGALVAPLLFVATGRWYDSTTARLAGIIAAIYLPSVYYEGLVLKTSLAMFLVTLVLAGLSWALAGRRGWPAWGGIGVALGLATLARGNLLLCVLALALWLLFAREIGRPRWRPALALVVGCGLVVGATAVRNRVVGGEWVLTTTNAGQNFFIGNNPLNADGQYARLPFVDPNPKYEERDFAREAERRNGRPMSPSEVSRYWFREARSWIRAHPTDWLRLTGRKLRIYWSAYEIPDNLDYDLYSRWAPVLRLPIPGFGLVAPLALLGVALSLRRRGWPRALLGFVVVYTASVVAFFVFSRFRMAMMPALFVFAGHGAAELGRRWRAARTGRAAMTRAWVAAALVAAAWLAVNLPVRGSPDRLGFRLAEALRLPRRLESSSAGHFNLGVAYAARAGLEEDPRPLLEQAEQELRLALAGESRYAAPHVELGKVLARLGRSAEAIAPYRVAVELEPQDYRNHHALGLLYRRLGELDEAEAAFRRALALAPRHVPSAVQLGEVLLEAGRYGEAERSFAYALGLAPDSASAAAGLRRARAASRGELNEP